MAAKFVMQGASQQRISPGASACPHFCGTTKKEKVY
jgi:hypothetical protein